MQAVVKADFYDVKAEVTRRAGEVFDCTKGRADEINAAFPGYVELKKQTKKKDE